MLRSKVLFLALVLTVLPFAGLQAAPPPPCSCELCLEDPDVKCNEKEGSCVHLLRSGVCLGESADLAMAQMTSPVGPAPSCEQVRSTPSAKEPVVDELAPQVDGLG